MIETLFALYALAALDALFSGICAASGRNAAIHKRAYFARSMLYGLAWGQVACLVAMLMLWGAIGLASDRQHAVEELVAVGQRMAGVYGAYAAVVLFTFAVRAIPSVDVRSITSVVGFGPLTVMRSAVIIGGLVWGLALGPGLTVAIAATLIAGMMIPFRLWLTLMLDTFGDRVLQARSQQAPR